MPTECVISLDHPNADYLSGEILNGHVMLRTSILKSIRGIKITIQGYSKNSWEESRSREVDGKTEHYTEYYSSNEQYLNFVTHVLGQNNGNIFDLEPGTYNYTFSCHLPFDLPSSCQERYGKTKYKVIVTIDQYLKIDKEFKITFFVKHSIDLNLNPSYKLPQKRTDQGGRCCCLCFCCCSSAYDSDNVLTAELLTPHSGFIPGEQLPFTFLVSNQLNNNVASYKVKFEKVKTFEARSTSGSEHKYIKHDIADKYFGEVLRFTNKEFKGFLQLPNNLECSQSNKIIEINYFLKARINVPCCDSDVHVKIPIIIGMIPFVETAEFPENVVVVKQPSAPVHETHDLPSYNEAVQVESCNDNEKNDLMNSGSSLMVAHHFELPTAPPPIYGDENQSNELDAMQKPPIGSNYGWTTKN